MTQVLYAHVNKIKIKKKRKVFSPVHMNLAVCGFEFTSTVAPLINGGIFQSAP
jgi:hypothetical protein